MSSSVIAAHVPTLSQADFAQHRQALIEQVGEHAAIVVMAASEHIRNRDTHYPFCQDSDFYHLTGFNEPDAVLVLRSSSDLPYTLFVRPRDQQLETWHGRRAGVAGVVADYGADQAFTLDQLNQKLPDLLSGCVRVVSSLYRNETLEKILKHALSCLRGKARLGIKAPDQLQDLDPILHAQRRIKTPSELVQLRAACHISAEAHIQAMRYCRPDMYEYQLEAQILQIFRHYGGDVAYQSIVGGGDNACILHYVENNQLLKGNDLVLIDAGCMINGYCGDITRTFPVNGRFTGAQRAVYEIVLAAFHAACQALKPNVAFNDYHDAAVAVLTQGLVDLKLLNGSVSGLIESGAYKPFYMHRTGHWLGRDVHDVGDYWESEGCATLLCENMLLTVEPGLYIAAGEGIDPRFAGIGVRIEDDLCITSTGYDNLTLAVPKEIAEIESLMQS